MRRLTTALLLALFSACFGSLCGGPAAAQPAGITALPHKATYDLSLDEMRSSSLVTDATGRMEFEWSDVCDGWAIQQRYRVTFVYDDGLTVNFGWSLSSWESKDGRRYRFFIRHFDGSGESQSVRGEAELGPDGSGRAVYTEPEHREIALPAGTRFPTGHTAYILANASAGAAPVWSLVFDGAGDEGLMGVSAAFSSELPPDSPTQLASPLLRGQLSWQLNLAFYHPDAASAEPEHEQVLRIFANGVSDDLRVDYGGFVLEADLISLTELPRPRC